MKLSDELVPSGGTTILSFLNILIFPATIKKNITYIITIHQSPLIKFKWFTRCHLNSYWNRFISFSIPIAGDKTNK